MTNKQDMVPVDNNTIIMSELLENRAFFNNPRLEGEENLLDFTGEHLEDISVELKELFLNTDYIVAIKDLSPIAQRVIINKYFNTQILIFRRYYVYNISELLMYLMNDVDIETWKTYMRDFIFPFFKTFNKQILEINK